MADLPNALMMWEAISRPMVPMQHGWWAALESQPPWVQRAFCRCHLSIPKVALNAKAIDKSLILLFLKTLSILQPRWAGVSSQITSVTIPLFPTSD